MKLTFKPAPRPLFSPFNGLDMDALREAEAAKKCRRGSKFDPKKGKCVPKRKGK